MNNKGTCAVCNSREDAMCPKALLIDTKTVTTTVEWSTMYRVQWSEVEAMREPIHPYW